MTHGIKFVLLLHFVVNLLLILEVFGSLWLPNGHWVSPDHFATQVIVTGYALVGLPVLLSALYGVVANIEVYLRLYMAYLCCSVAFSSYFIIKIFLLSGPCSSASSLMREVGRAFACGVATIGNDLLVTVMWGLQLYFLYVVWSYAEDMATGGAVGFSDLACDSDVLLEKRKIEDPFGSLAGLQDHVPTGYGSVYEAAADGGIGGSTRLFGMSRHDMQYPPARQFVMVG